MKTAANVGLQALLVVGALVAYDVFRGAPAAPASRDTDIPPIERLGPIGAAHLTETAAETEAKTDAGEPAAAARDRRVAELEARVSALSAQVEREVSARALPPEPPAPIDVRGILAPTLAAGHAVAESTANDVARFRELDARTRDTREMERRARVFREQLRLDDVRLSSEQEQAVVEAMLRYQAALPDDPRTRNEPDDPTGEAQRRRQELREEYEREVARIVSSSDAAKVVRATNEAPLRAAVR